jgi:hypothetical protein
MFPWLITETDNKANRKISELHWGDKEKISVLFELTRNCGK